MTNEQEIQLTNQTTPITKETIRDYLCPKATDQELIYILNTCRQTGMNPFVRDVDIIKFGTSPAQIVTRKDWFFKTANTQPDYEGMEHGIIVMRKDAITYQEGAFMAPNDVLLGGWASVYRKFKRPHRAEVTLSEYDKKQSNWNNMKATMINKVAKVHALRESFPEKFQGIVDEYEMDAIEASATTSKPKIEMPTKVETVKQVKKVVKENVEEPKKDENKAESSELVCDECNVAVTENIGKFSKKEFDIPLCFDCQKVARTK